MEGSPRLEKPAQTRIRLRLGAESSPGTDCPGLGPDFCRAVQSAVI